MAQAVNVFHHSHRARIIGEQAIRSGAKSPVTHFNGVPCLVIRKELIREMSARGFTNHEFNIFSRNADIQRPELIHDRCDSASPGHIYSYIIMVANIDKVPHRRVLVHIAVKYILHVVKAEQALEAIHCFTPSHGNYIPKSLIPMSALYTFACSPYLVIVIKVHEGHIHVRPVELPIQVQLVSDRFSQFFFGFIPMLGSTLLRFPLLQGQKGFKVAPSVARLLQSYEEMTQQELIYRQDVFFQNRILFPKRKH